ncbi:IclR family transcriptional regulator [Fusobacterium necrophorum]|uniref:Transcriptional regulator n=1 Tax=Fusobacterium necrophorum BL TaxID=1441732 RepID=A0AB73BUF6_9FUSO|nr:IclR family transcriptional regulator [Fusobacterium necrophorum]AYZ72892.1 IclR family transcriptional regulator [Fusobacterium necrophorum]AZW09108.1 IclR family transcriptional regulator [Fusobacterium necrophorum subsp. necrophorum]KDE62062.1 transcriptional regulator [Fusobacterium necrophorum BL]KDE68017.1 transcriptional regulator [Fusobacterium necrophorum BFTR-2]SDB12785.1 transcriptional regulator, IclR family [Fusobacterium necrophorum]
MIKSLNKAIEILEILKNSSGGCSLAYIYTKLNIPKSTAYGLLQTLVSKMYVLKDEKSLYKLGPSLILLGKRASLEMGIQNIVLPILRELSSEIEVDSFLMVPTGYKGIVLERVEGTQSIHVIEKFGNEFYLHCGATRKAILANKSEQFISEYIETVFKNKKNRPNISIEELKTSLKKIKEEGVAVSYGEYAKGTIGIGAPLYDYTEEVVASLGINLLEDDFLTEEKIKKYKEIVRLKSIEASKKMGYLK